MGGHAGHGHVDMVAQGDALLEGLAAQVQIPVAQAGLLGGVLRGVEDQRHRLAGREDLDRGGPYLDGSGRHALVDRLEAGTVEIDTVQVRAQFGAGLLHLDQCRRNQFVAAGERGIQLE